MGTIVPSLDSQLVALDPAKLIDPSSNDKILSAFLDCLIETNVEPYDHQEQAILE